MQGPHQCAPTYSPKTVCPGLDANNGAASISNSLNLESGSSEPIKPTWDIVSIKQTNDSAEREDDNLLRSIVNSLYNVYYNLSDLMINRKS